MPIAAAAAVAVALDVALNVAAADLTSGWSKAGGLFDAHLLSLRP